MGKIRVSAVAMVVVVAAALVFGVVVVPGADASPLTHDFYATSCPDVLHIVKAEVKKAVRVELRMAASLTRLHFHDCFVNGCDGSILLDNSPTIQSEKYSLPNNNSVRGFEVIDAIKTALEAACPQTVSCADIVAIAALYGTVEAGGIEYKVLLGRRDSLTANQSAPSEFLPSPFANYPDLLAHFVRVGLDERDLVTLSGAHTFGRAHCRTITPGLIDGDGINSDFAAKLTLACPNSSADSVLLNLDFSTPNKFDNNYFKQLRKGEGVLHSDRVLESTPGSNVDIVKDYAENRKTFLKQFAISNIKMGNIKPLTGTQGEIRINCRVPNSAAQVLVASE
jgi:peroxidase